jgi:hypothetical protein
MVALLSAELSVTGPMNSPPAVTSLVTSTVPVPVTVVVVVVVVVVVTGGVVVVGVTVIVTCGVVWIIVLTGISEKLAVVLIFAPTLISVRAAVVTPSFQPVKLYPALGTAVTAVPLAP